jgi:hypothetical protein
VTRRPRAVRLGIPGAIVGVLAIVALWRLGGTPPSGNRGQAAAPVSAPITAVVDLVAHNTIGRQASLDRVQVGEMVSARAFWIGTSDEKAVFAALDRAAAVPAGLVIAQGTHIAITGVVQPASDAAAVASRLGIDAATAAAVARQGTYLLVTAVRRAADPEP